MKKPTILIDVDSDGTVQVHWHDTEESGRTPPEISVVYSYERGGGDGTTWVDDHDNMIRDEWGTQRIF